MELDQDGFAHSQVAVADSDTWKSKYHKEQKKNNWAFKKY